MRKHLFVVHSSITWRMTRGIIEQLGLTEQECVLLTDRAFAPDEDVWQQQPIGQWTILPLRWSERSQLPDRCRRNRLHRAALDRFLTEEIAQPYYVYLPHTWSYPYLALREHPYCEQYFLVEEGTLSYRDDLSLYQRQPAIWRRLLLRQLLHMCGAHGLPEYPLSLDTQHPRYGGCYGMHEDSFPLAPPETRITIPPPFARREAYAAFKSVLIAGPWLEREYCHEAEYRQFVRLLLRYFTRVGVHQLHVKFHPLQHAKMRSIPIFRAIAQDFQDKIQVIELDPAVSPEEIAYSSQADLYLGYSSLAIYAHRFGRRVFSYAWTLADNWPAFRRGFEELPLVLTEALIPIDLTLEVVEP